MRQATIVFNPRSETPVDNGQALLEKILDAVEETLGLPVG